MGQAAQRSLSPLVPRGLGAAGERLIYLGPEYEPTGSPCPEVVTLRRFAGRSAPRKENQFCAPRSRPSWASAPFRPSLVPGGETTFTGSMPGRVRATPVQSDRALEPGKNDER